MDLEKKLLEAQKLAESESAKQEDLQSQLRVSSQKLEEASSKLKVLYGLEHPRIETEVLGHSLVRSLVRSHCSLAHLLHPSRFARAFRCAHFAHSLARGRVNNGMSQNDLVLSHRPSTTLKTFLSTRNSVYNSGMTSWRMRSVSWPSD